MSGLGSGLAQLFKTGRKRIGNAIDNYLVGGADARKAISDEVRSKFQPMIEQARNAGSKRAANITELGDKLAESKKAFQDAQKAWQDKYNSELAAAKAQRQKDIDAYNTKLQGYQDAVDNAKQGKQSIADQLSDLENIRDPFRTIYTDVTSGDNYVLHPITHKYINISKLYPRLSEKEARNLTNRIQNYETRLWDKSSNKVINVFDESNKKNYGNGKYSAFDSYLSTREGQNAALLRDLKDAGNRVTRAKSDFNNWKNDPNKPQAWDETTQGNNDLTNFDTNFRANNVQPTEYSFNGQNYANAAELDKAYQDALKHEKALQDSFSKSASRQISERNAEIAKRIQDAKDVKKAKLFLGGTLGAGALAAGAAAMYGGDDTDNSETPDNIDTTDNTYTGEPDPDFNVEKEGQAILKDHPYRQQIDTGFDPDKAAAVLASGAYDQGAEDGNSIESSDDHFIDDDELYGLLKAMKDPHKADAVANYIYSKHGDKPDVQRLGWRGWLNKYYGDLLRSRMGLDPSSYNGMHISGGL